MCGFPRTDRWTIVILIAITAIAGVLRLYHLDWQCLASDEYYTIKAMGLSSLEQVVLWSLGSDYNPPVYYVAAYISSAIIGSVTPFSIRFPAMIFGIIVIPAMYLLGNEMRGKTLGLLMAAVAAFLFPYVYYSQNARAYTLIMLTFIGFVVMFIRVYRGDVRNITIVLLSFFVVLCFWSHFYSIIPIAISMIILSIKYRKVLILSSIAVSVLCIPFLRYIPAIINHFQQIGNLVHNEFWFTPIQVAIMMPNELLCWSWLVILPMAIISASKNLLHRDLSAISIITIVTCVFPMSYLTAVSPRYVLLVSPVILLLAFYPLSEWIDRQCNIERKVTSFIAIVFVMFLFNIGSLVSWYTFNICPYV